MVNTYSFAATPFDDSAVVELLTTYRNEVSEREADAGRSLDMSMMTGTAADATADQMVPPNGVFLGVFRDGVLIGCGGVRATGDHACEIKRMFVVASARGGGIARALLSRLEAEGAGLGCRLARLDTRTVLTEARALYLSAGYVEVDRYNDNPFAQHWFEKPLDR